MHHVSWKRPSGAWRETKSKRLPAMRPVSIVWSLETELTAR
jgi:hypothetical protein